MSQSSSRPQTGFAAVETILVLIIIGIVAGVGYWVATQRNNSTSPSDSTVGTTAVTAKAGTLTAIDQLTQADSQDETAIDTKYQATDQSAVTSSDAAATNIGGAYNESNF